MSVEILEQYCRNQLPEEFRKLEGVCPCSLLVKYRDFGYEAALRYVWEMRK